MTRSLFGVASSDWSVNIGVDRSMRVADGNLTAWDSRTGGTRITDLQDISGGAISTVYASLGQYAFYGPDGVRSLWVDGGGGDRELLAALPDLLADTVTQANRAQSAADIAQGSSGGIGGFIDNGDGTVTLVDGRSDITTATNAATAASGSAAAAAASASTAQTASDAAVAVGTTNDTVIAGRINAAGSATQVALNAAIAAGIASSGGGGFDGGTF